MMATQVIEDDEDGWLPERMAALEAEYIGGNGFHLSIQDRNVGEKEEGDEVTFQMVLVVVVADEKGVRRNGNKGLCGGGQ
ncbi:hypothetical protein L2E82_13465 [Cichorium intybus]|uniref:Uncharacterized protein n=1 Tax=Cichorium intybus TaxID=13427 RepID=A0ACB9EY37_CICIN|nr:hypothetical protein L2E82_13465 [Cichorium intybus]